MHHTMFILSISLSICQSVFHSFCVSRSVCLLLSCVFRCLNNYYCIVEFIVLLVVRLLCSTLVYFCILCSDTHELE